MFVNAVHPGKSLKMSFLSPGKPWNLVFASPGRQCFNVYMQTGSRSSAVAAMEFIVSWIESCLYPCLTASSHHRRQRRLLTAVNCSVLADPSETSTTTDTLCSQSSDASVLQRSDDASGATTRHFVVALVKVCCY